MRPSQSLPEQAPGRFTLLVLHTGALAPTARSFPHVSRWQGTSSRQVERAWHFFIPLELRWTWSASCFTARSFSCTICRKVFVAPASDPVSCSGTGHVSPAWTTPDSLQHAASLNASGSLSNGVPGMIPACIPSLSPSLKHMMSPARSYIVLSHSCTCTSATWGPPPARQRHAPGQRGGAVGVGGYRYL